MSHPLNLLALGALAAMLPIDGWADPAPAQFMAAVQFEVRETSQLLPRSQQVARRLFFHTVESWPELRGRHYDVQTMGNKLVFSLLSENDMRLPVRNAVSEWVKTLGGKVSGSGRTDFYRFYRTSLSQAMGRGFEIVTMIDKTGDKNAVKFLTLRAEGVPVRDLMEALTSKVPSLNYMVDPKECFDHLITLNFVTSDEAEAMGIDGAMKAIAKYLSIKYEKENGVHFFMGGCTEPKPEPIQRQKPPELLPSGFTLEPQDDPIPPQAHVYFRVIRAE